MKEAELEEEKVELEPNQIWQVPDKECVKIRHICHIWSDGDLTFFELGKEFCEVVPKKSFLQWVRRNNAKLIGLVEESGKVRVVK